MGNRNLNDAVYEYCKTLLPIAVWKRKIRITNMIAQRIDPRFLPNSSNPLVGSMHTQMTLKPSGVPDTMKNTNNAISSMENRLRDICRPRSL